MADTPKATPMTLEEAVEIFAEMHRKAGVEDHLEAWTPITEREDRARAIVDQAVRFVKAREQEWDGLTPQPGAIEEFYKLRAMQRGESEVKP